MSTSEPREPDDHELLRRMLTRDDRAWRIFIDRYRRLIIATTRRISQSFQAHYLIEDDDVFAALLGSLLHNDMQKLRAYDPARGLRLSSWISMLTAHITWDLLRDSRRRTTLGDQVRQLQGQQREPDFGLRMMFREDCERLARARERLSKNDQRFFDLFYLECVEAPEIATTLRISLKTVYTRNHKVRTKLRDALDDQRDDKRRRPLQPSSG